MDGPVQCVAVWRILDSVCPGAGTDCFPPQMGRNEHGSILVTATCSRVKSRICIWTEVKVWSNSAWLTYCPLTHAKSNEKPPTSNGRRGELWFHSLLFVAVVLVTIFCNIVNSLIEDGLGMGLYRSLGRMIRRWLYDPRQAHEIPSYLDLHMS